MNTLEDNKAVIRRLFDEALNQGKLAVLNELYASSFVSHNKDGTDKQSTPQDEIASRENQFSRVVDLRVEYDEPISEGDMVAARWIAHGRMKDKDEEFRYVHHYFVSLRQACVGRARGADRGVCVPRRAAAQADWVA